jgi:BirA family transcriptional regulator, biotin operon repressor / biotin---[acetyl-CoA-carboxylase] ligase
MFIGNKQLHFEQVASTNDIAWQYAGDQESNGLIVVADEQLSGRGRRGDAWVSPPGSALYLSILLHPDASCRHPVMLTIWAGLGVCSMIGKKLSLKPLLKWPNDVQIAGKKVCGILVEQRQQWFVVGVGLNLAIPVQHFQGAGIHQAASLQDFTDVPMNQEEVLDELKIEWDQLYAEMMRGNKSHLIKLWHEHSGLLTKAVQLVAAGKERTGTIRQLNWDEIVLEAEGKLTSFQPQTVTKLRLVT